jgi:hypothetical protein
VHVQGDAFVEVADGPVAEGHALDFHFPWRRAIVLQGPAVAAVGAPLQGDLRRVQRQVRQHHLVLQQGQRVEGHVDAPGAGHLRAGRGPVRVAHAHILGADAGRGT